MTQKQKQQLKEAVLAFKGETLQGLRPWPAIARIVAGRIDAFENKLAKELKL